MTDFDILGGAPRFRTDITVSNKPVEEKFDDLKRIVSGEPTRPYRYSELMKDQGPSTSTTENLLRKPSMGDTTPLEAGINSQPDQSTFELEFPDGQIVKLQGDPSDYAPGTKGSIALQQRYAQKIMDRIERGEEL